MRWFPILMVLGLLSGFGPPAGAGGPRDKKDLIADVKWLEGGWHLPAQKVMYKGKAVEAIPGFRVNLFFRKPDRATGSITFSLDGLNGEYLDVLLQLRCDFELVEKKGERFARLKDKFSDRTYLVEYEIKGKELHLKFDRPMKLGEGEGAVDLKQSGRYRRYPRLVVQEDLAKGHILKRPAYFKQLIGKLGLGTRGPSTDHTSDGDENLPGGRYLSATLLSADKDKYVVSFSALDYWSQKRAAGGIETFTSTAAGRIEIPVGKELRTLSFKFRVED